MQFNYTVIVDEWLPNTYAQRTALGEDKDLIGMLGRAVPCHELGPLIAALNPLHSDQWHAALRTERPSLWDLAPKNVVGVCEALDRTFLLESFYTQRIARDQAAELEEYLTPVIGPGFADKSGQAGALFRFVHLAVDKICEFDPRADVYFVIKKPGWAQAPKWRAVLESQMPVMLAGNFLGRAFLDICYDDYTYPELFGLVDSEAWASSHFLVAPTSDGGSTHAKLKRWREGRGPAMTLEECNAAIGANLPESRHASMSTYLDKRWDWIRSGKAFSLGGIP